MVHQQAQLRAQPEHLYAAHRFVIQNAISHLTSRLEMRVLLPQAATGARRERLCAVEGVAAVPPVERIEHMQLELIRHLALHLQQ